MSDQTQISHGLIQGWYKDRDGGYYYVIPDSIDADTNQPMVVYVPYQGPNKAKNVTQRLLNFLAFSIRVGLVYLPKPPFDVVKHGNSKRPRTDKTV